MVNESGQAAKKRAGKRLLAVGLAGALALSCMLTGCKKNEPEPEPQEEPEIENLESESEQKTELSEEKHDFDLLPESEEHPDEELALRTGDGGQRR